MVAEWMDVELPANAPGCYANGLTPDIPDLAPMYEAGWRVHDHHWLGNGQVRMRLTRVAAKSNDLRTLEQKAADDAHIAKVRSLGAVAYPGTYMTGDPPPGAVMPAQTAPAMPFRLAEALAAMPPLAERGKEIVTYRCEWFAGGVKPDAPVAEASIPPEPVMRCESNEERRNARRPVLVVEVDDDGVAHVGIHEGGRRAVLDNDQLLGVLMRSVDLLRGYGPYTGTVERVSESQEEMRAAAERVTDADALLPLEVANRVHRKAVGQA